MAIRKTGTCDKCNKDLYGDEYGACGHACLTIVGEELAEVDIYRYRIEQGELTDNGISIGIARIKVKGRVR